MVLVENITFVVDVIKVLYAGGGNVGHSRREHGSHRSEDRSIETDTTGHSVCRERLVQAIEREKIEEFRFRSVISGRLLEHTGP